MPEYIVRTLPGETTVRVSRPGGTTRVRTRLTSSTVYVTGGGGGDHNDTTNRDAADAHPISAITGLQDALDALTGGGGSNLRVDVAVVDDTDSIDLGAAAPDNIPAVLIWGRAAGNGVYEASVADGWTLLDPQPTLVVADALVQAPAYDPVLDTGVASIYDYSDTAGWQPVGSVPTLDGNSSQVWGPTGWVTLDSGASALDDLTDVDVTTDPPDTDDVLAWDGTNWTPATPVGGAPLSDATPEDLGTAAAGTAEEAARADHVHDMPTASDVGADAAGSAAAAEGYAVQRVNHTGSQAISTVSGLQAALDGKSATGHGHAVSDVTGLQTALDGKAPAQRTVGTGLGTSGTVNLDMASVHGTIQTIAATGAITFTTSNRAAGREVTLVISAGGSSRALAWPAWTAVGAALPTELASGKTLVATVTFTDTTDAAAIAAAAVQP